MTGVLARLVARARGAAASGVRPRLPARFEGPSAPLEAGGAGTPPARGPEIAGTGRDPAAAGRQQVEGVLDTPEPGPDPGAAPVAQRAGKEMHGPAHEFGRDRDTGRNDTARRPERPVHQAGAPQRPPPPGRGESREPALDRPRAGLQSVAVPEPRKAGPRGSPAPAASAAPEEALPRSDGAGSDGAGSDGARADAPPAPLMPVRPAPSFAPADDAPRDAAVTVGGAAEAPPHAAAAPEPDIVIHIGRIDLKAPAEPAPQPRPRPARKETTSLHNYLADRSGGR